MKTFNIIIGFMCVVCWALANEFIHVVFTALDVGNTDGYYLFEISIILFGFAIITASVWLILGDEIENALKKRYKIIKLPPE